MSLISFVVTGAAALLLSYSVAAAESVYVPLGDANTVIAIDPTNDTVVSRIEGVPAAHGLAATPDGRYLIAGSFEERVADVPPPKPAVVGEEEHASHHAMEPDNGLGRAMVLSTVSVIQVSDGSIVRRIDVPGVVHHVAVSPNGRLAVVTHPNEGTISAIDLESYRVVTTLPTGPIPNYAVFSPDSSRLYVSNAGNDTVSDIDVSRWIVMRNIIVGESPEHVVLSHDGNRLYVNNINAGTVSVINTESDTVLDTIKVGSVLHGIDLSADDQTLFVASLTDNELAAIDVGTGKMRVAPLAPDPYHLAVIRADKLYVSSASEPKIWVVDPQSLNRINEIEIGGKGHQMAVAAGG